jgi:flagellar export protein FliJ
MSSANSPIWKTAWRAKGSAPATAILKSIEGRRENLRATHKDIERERAQAQEDLTSAFQDLKALEFATEQQAKRAEEVEARRAQSRLDEMALVRHLRKHALRGA